MSAEINLQQFVSLQKRLLELELRADEEHDGNSGKDTIGDGGGFFLRNVDVIDTSIGLYGRTVVSFGQNTTTNFDSKDSEAKQVAAALSSWPLLAAHRLTVGDEIEVLPKNAKTANSKTKSKRVGGVVCAVNDYSISIALEDKKRQSSNGGKSSYKKNDVDDVELDEESDMLGGTPPYTLVPRSGVEVHKKMISALNEMEKYGVHHPIAGDIILSAFEPSNSLIDDKMTKSRIEELENEYNLSSTKLDYCQKEAIIFALNSKSPISLIHGPPGTGKTTTVAELIQCAVNIKNYRVLVTAPSNVAVDNVLERMMALENESSRKVKRKSSKKSKNQRIKAVRLGHPARIQHNIQQYSLESLVKSSDGTEIVQDCRRELNNHLELLSNPRSRQQDKRNAYREMKALRKEIRTREEKVVGELLRDANVVLATNVGAAGSVFRHMVDSKGEPMSFDLVIIDEAAQALEASCWISLLRGKKAVLAGDHCQLPPTIKCSNSEVQTGLRKTLFERLMNEYDSNKNKALMKPSKMLKVQYRMHEDIANWASNAMYNGRLISHESVRYRKLNSLEHVQEKIDTTPSKDDENPSMSLQDIVLTIIDTTGCGFNEMTTDAGSRYNEGEAQLVVSHVQSLLTLGIRAEDIAVITPYNGQVELLRKQLLPEIPKLEIRSVDGFQGGEREAVVLSLVRSSERVGENGVGFLRDERRLNVAITRAKRHCAVICDCETVSQNKFIGGLIEWMEQKGDYRSGAELTLSNENYIHPVQPVEKNTVSSTNKKSHFKNEKTAVIKQKPDSNLAPNQDLLHVAESPAQDTLKEDARRILLTKQLVAFSEEEKREQLVLSDLSDFDLVVVRELTLNLGLKCEKSSDSNAMTVSLSNKTRTSSKPLETERSHDDNTKIFSQLDAEDNDGDDEEDDNTYEESKIDILTQNNLLRSLALERQKRQNIQQIRQTNESNNSDQIKKKDKKKKHAKNLGGGKKQTKKSQDEDNFDELDDMAFLDAQIEKVQTSHGRKIEAKGKGYKSIVNGVLLTKHERPETKKHNTVVANSLQAKIKAKSNDRRGKKKSK